MRNIQTGSWLPRCRGARIIASTAAQQTAQLGRIQPVPAHFHAIQKQHRHMQSITPLQVRVSVRIQLLDRRQRHGVSESEQILVHLVAQIAAVATDQRQSRFQGDRSQRRPPPDGLGPPPPMADVLGAERGVLESVELAMARTVSGGTSPMAVTRYPLPEVE